MSAMVAEVWTIPFFFDFFLAIHLGHSSCPGLAVGLHVVMGFANVGCLGVKLDGDIVNRKCDLDLFVKW